MNKTTIYLIRHGQAEGNIYNRSHGVTDTLLTPKGREQVELLRKRFVDIPFDCIYSSDLTRALMTAEPLAIDKGYKVNIRHNLHEVDLGIFEDTSWYEMKVRFPEYVEQWVIKRPFYAPPDGESYDEAKHRFYNEMVSIAKENKGKTVVVVAHASVIKEFQQVVGDYSKCYSENTAVSLYEFENERFVSIYNNDFSHLPGINDLFMQNGEFSKASIDAYTLEYLPTFTQETVKKKDIIVGYQLGLEVGKISYETIGKIVYVNYLEIYEELRNKGYGSQLLGEVIYRGRNLGLKRIVIRKEALNISDSVMPFLLKNDFLVDSNGNYYKNIRFILKR